ncbi:hypothetical protein LO771_04730 [Streptacidiphilus sp. ASG 303]|uniref:hypothetical protein n=1 Tax=Streptacidiphilus sp. ASG 303 TaxID=2896847 RepID=UPI001E36290F|nr:hypothetical protein [Streptacidiphilus sp. ASG 303]MCD0481735.1 hypothetical protein [Streptacidiphilus sp. ASG 303]
MQVGTVVPGAAGINGFVTALRMAESVLFSGGQQVARRNAWDAVCENRRQAADRAETATVLGALAAARTTAAQDASVLR